MALKLFVFNLIAMAVIVGVVFEQRNLAGFAVLFFVFSELAVFSVAVVEQVLRMWMQNIKDTGKRFLMVILPDFE